MSKKKKNSYEKKAKKSKMMHHITDRLPTANNVKNTLLETGKDLVIGVLAGGLTGAAIGKPSLLVGLGISGIGHYTDHKLISLFGLGVMASNGFQNKSVSGLSGMDGVKERIAAYKDNFAEKLYITHILPKSMNGLNGKVQFFNYADDIDELRTELDAELKTLDRIEQEIEKSGVSHARNTGVNLDESDSSIDNDIDDEEYDNEEEDNDTSMHQHTHRHNSQQQQDDKDVDLQSVNI
jgi:hypothetical protein